MSNGLNRQSTRNVATGALDKLKELSDKVSQLEQFVQQNFKLYADLFNKLGESLVNYEDKSTAFEQLLGTTAVEEIVVKKQNDRRQEQEEKNQKRIESEKEFITKGLQNGYMTAVETVTEDTVVVGQQLNSQNQVIGLTRSQFFLKQMNEQVQSLFVGKTVDSIVTLPQGETFKILEAYYLDINKFQETMKAQQEKLNQDLQVTTQPVETTNEVPLPTNADDSTTQETQL